MLTDYPIFQKWYTTLNWILDKVETFPKSVRFTISTKISNISIEILELIIEMIYNKSKRDFLLEIILKLEKLRIFFRLTKDRTYLSIKQYEFVIRNIDEVGRMVGGMMKG